MKHFFVILGGMGTPATNAFINLLTKKTPANQDQDYLNYILVNHASIPDRTKYILNHNQPNPLKPLLDDVSQLNQLHPEFYAIACNTAHYFYQQIKQVANAPVFNMPVDTIKSIKYKFPQAKRIGLIATEGTIKDKIYDKAIKNTNYHLVKPTLQIEKEVMHLIYHDVKSNNDSAPELYVKILNQMINGLNCNAVILGCTELSLAQERNTKLITNSKQKHLLTKVIDSQAVLVNHSLHLAEKLQKKNNRKDI